MPVLCNLHTVAHTVLLGCSSSAAGSAFLSWNAMLDSPSCGIRRPKKVHKNHWSGLVLTKLSFHTDSIMLYKRKVTFLELMPILGYMCIYVFCSVTVQYGNTALLASILYPQCK